MTRLPPPSSNALTSQHVLTTWLNLNVQECTEKTWPEFWDSCLPALGISTAAHSAWKDEEETTEEGGKERAQKSCEADPSVVVVGMRGAGKTTMGKSAAESLGLGE